MNSLARPLVAVTASFILLLGVTSLAVAGPPSSSISYMEIYRGIRAGRVSTAAAANNLVSHGGSVQTAPKVYISYWGTEWNTGFTTGGHTSAQARAYIEGFFGNVGGSAWNSVVTQYCQGIVSGTAECSGASATPVGNQTGQFVGSWVDTTSVPRRIRQSDIAKAAQRLANHFGGVKANATYMVYTPTGKSMGGFKTSWCAWHSSSGSMAYAYIPYMPDAGGNCGMNFVNSGSADGYFDGFSIVAGHEYSEAETDPFPSSGWVDSGGAENADKCAWSSLSGNIILGSKAYAVQPTWSNLINGCPAVS